MTRLSINTTQPSRLEIQLQANNNIMDRQSQLDCDVCTPAIVLYTTSPYSSVIYIACGVRHQILLVPIYADLPLAEARLATVCTP